MKKSSKNCKAILLSIVLAVAMLFNKANQVWMLGLE